MSEARSVRVWEPSSFDALTKASAGIFETWGFVGGAVVGVGGSGIGGATEGGGVDLGGDEIGVRKVILLVTQSINGLCRVSQLYPKTVDQVGSSGVTKNSTVRVSPVGNRMGMVTLSEII